MLCIWTGSEKLCKDGFGRQTRGKGVEAMSETSVAASGNVAGRKFLRGALFAMLGGVCWGFSGACGQFLMSTYGVDPVWIMAVRLTIAGTVILIACLVMPSQRKVLLSRDFLCSWRNVRDIVAFGALGLALLQFCYLMAIDNSNAGTATVLSYIGPVFVVLYGCLREKRAPRKNEVLALGCVLIGAFIIATHGNPANMVITPAGLAWGLLCALCMVFYTVIPERIMKSFGSMPVTSVSMLLTGAVLSVAFLPRIAWPEFDLLGVLAIGGMVVFGTIFAFMLYLEGVSLIGAARASMLSSVETISAAGFAVLWLGTTFAPFDLVGFTFIMCTVFLLTDFSPRNVFSIISRVFER